MEVILNINDLTYNDLFDNMSLYIEKNSFITISGSNNCGKTTLLRILSRQINIPNNIVLFNKNINDYSIEEYTSVVKCVIPKEILFNELTLEEEISKFNIDKKYTNYLVKELKLKKVLTKDINSLTTKEIILSQILLSLINKPKVLLLDCLDNYFTNKEIEELYKFLREYKANYDLTIITTTIDLNNSLLTDYLYIINNKKIILEGTPITILQKDNIINKSGLSLPFMIDLSVKLRDYELIDKIILDKEAMVNTIWK